MKRTIKKAIITAAGRGTRFLPITKIIPKEMLPIGNEPTLHYLLAECKDSGITDVAIVVREVGSLTEKYFQVDSNLETYLIDHKKQHLVEQVHDTNLGLNLTFILQDSSLPYGHGNPILSAKDWIGDSDFAMMFGDDIVKGEKPALAQLIEAWQSNPDLEGVVGTVEVATELITSMSTVKSKHANLNNKVKLLEDYIEKPKLTELYSNQIFIGRGLYNAGIIAELISHLPNIPEGREFYLWDAMLNLARKKPFGVLEIAGEWLTTGTPELLAIAAKKLLGY